MKEKLTQIKDKISCETNRILSVAKYISDLDCEDEKSVVDFAKEFSNTYFSLKSLIETQLSVEDIGTPLQSDISEQNAVEERNHPYCWLALYVTKIMHCIGGISGENRRNMMINISDMLASYRELVNYRDPAEATALSSLDVYPKLWRMSIDILVMEMNARFAYLRRIRNELLDNLQDLPCTEKDEKFKKLARQYNGCFAMYANACETAAPLKYILVNYYSKYLISFINFGESVYPIIQESSFGCWPKCFRFMKDLWDYKHVDDEMRSQWFALSKIMVSIFQSDVL